MITATASGTPADHRPGSVLLFAVSFVVLGLGAFWGLPSGKNVAGALVILDGGVPYRDFWTMYAPGQFYAVAALYWLFGAELLVQALAAAAVRAWTAVIFLRLLRRLGASTAAAMASSAVFVLMFWTTAPALTDYPLALPFVLLALDHLVRYYEGEGEEHLRGAGLWLGIAAWFKHDIAAYVAAGAVVSLFAAARIVRPAHGSWRPPVRAALTVLRTALLAAVPVAAWTAWTAGVEAWNDLIVFPAIVFSKVRNESFPPLIPDLSALWAWLADVTHVRHALRASESLSTWIILYAPAFIFMAGAAALLAWRRRMEGARLASLTLLLACMPFFFAAVQVQHNTHPYSLAVLAAGVLVIVWRALETPRSHGVRRALLAGSAVYAIGLLMPPAVKAAAVQYEWAGSRPLDLPGFRGVRVPARVYASFHPLGQFFRSHTVDHEPIYTGLARHDAIVVNNALLYAIAGRRACCGYTELHPGVADRTPVQEEIVRRIEEEGVRAIALWRFGWADEVMEARKRHTIAGVPDAGATVLDRYIGEHFEVVDTYGEYQVLWRRDLPLPRETHLSRAR